jgi:Protein of unknown function (DUF4038)/Putative collagen-binding domain of a collagenase
VLAPQRTRHFARAAAVLVAVFAGMLVSGCARTPSGTDEDTLSSTQCLPSPAAHVNQTARPRFPLRVKLGSRYLIDSRGKPFLLQGDAAWSLIAELDRNEVNKYLADRKARGFNTLLVNLLEHAFASNAPSNAYGDAPFTSPGDYATPNEAYFAYADWVLERAAKEGFLVLLAPSYVGYRDTDQGWWQEMLANGPAKMRAFGRYLGRRYAHLHNIVWVEGGDDNPPEPGIVDALAAGISETDPGALQTAHTAPESSPLDTWNGRTWLAINNVYTYKDVYAASIAAYRRSELPFFLMESAYENEHSVSTRQIRTQAWQALLGGATGQIFGNNPIWHFSGPGLYPRAQTWEDALSSPGSRSMTIVAHVFGALPWWRLVPDEVGDALIVGGRGAGNDRAVASLACDRRWGLLYVPTRRTLTIDVGAFAGSTVTLTWIDPTTGAGSRAKPGSARTRGEVRLSPPGNNSSGESDWLLKMVAH